MVRPAHVALCLGAALGSGWPRPVSADADHRSAIAPAPPAPKTRDTPEPSARPLETEAVGPIERYSAAQDCVRRQVRFSMPDPDPQTPQVTHAWPHWQWPSVYLESRPAFLLRVDQVADPQTVLSTIRITGPGLSSWQRIRWEIRACVIEQDEDTGSSFTTIVFQPREPLRPGGGYNWLVSTHESPVFKPLHEGLTTTNRQAGGVFGVGGQDPQVGAVFDGTKISAALGVGRHPAEIWSALRNAQESFIMIREWSDLTIPRSADQELEARMKEFRVLQGDATPPWRLIR